MKSFKKLHKVICLIISILITASLLGGCEFSITTGSSSSRESQASKSSSSSTGDFAVKYKDYEIDFDEYLYIVGIIMIGLKDKAQNWSIEQFVSSAEVNDQPAAVWIKQASIQRATDFLMSREKLKQSGKDLDENSKKSIQDFSSDSNNLKYATIMGASQKGVKSHAEDAAKFIGLKNANIDLGTPQEGELTVNEEVIGKVDMIDLAKRVDECIKNGASLDQ